MPNNWSFNRKGMTTGEGHDNGRKGMPRDTLCRELASCYLRIVFVSGLPLAVARDNPLAHKG